MTTLLDAPIPNISGRLVCQRKSDSRVCDMAATVNVEQKKTIACSKGPQIWQTQDSSQTSNTLLPFVVVICSSPFVSPPFLHSSSPWMEQPRRSSTVILPNVTTMTTLVSRLQSDNLNPNLKWAGPPPQPVDVFKLWAVESIKKKKQVSGCVFLVVFL